MSTHFKNKNPGRSRRFSLAAGLVLLALGLVLPAAAQAVTVDVVAMDQVITYNRMAAFSPAGMIFALARDVFPKSHNGPYDVDNSCASGGCTPGQVKLRPDKRPRPLTLRVNEGDTIEITLTNLLSPGITDAQNEAPGIELCEENEGDPRPGICQSEQPATRNVGIHVHGLRWANGPQDDGSKVGGNATSLDAPGGASVTYEYIADKEGAYTITSGPNLGGQGGSGALASGLFGILNVEPDQSVWYRSQLTRADMLAATPGEEFTDWNGNGVWDQNIPEPFINDWNDNGTFEANYPEPFEDTVVVNNTLDPGEPFTDLNGNGSWDASLTDEFTDWNGNAIWDAIVTEPLQDTNGDGVFNAHRTTPGGQPIIDYDAVYPAGHPYAGEPILKILDSTGEIVHNELNAIITPGPSGFNDPAPYPLYPNRGEAFREFSIIFHDEIKVVQAFPGWFNALPFTLGSVKDGFAINYGTGGIGSEIIGNRLGVGPMWPCAECKYEEFFLTSWAVGDPAMIVDVPANAGLEALAPGATPPAGTTGPKATKAFYPDDPSNVWHGYLNDRTKIRNIHVGTEHHIFHLHAHQWNFINRDEDAASGDQSNYLDAQALGPGSSFTYEITFGGGGNRNKTAGDSIFHCHFYPHFAQGMWGLWRVHDTFEIGSLLDPNGRVLERGLPDSEITGGGYQANGAPIPGGTPTPAVVPIPGKAMAPMPGLMLFAYEDNDGDDIPEVLSATESAPFMGYPFYIPGVAGHRPPTPPSDLEANGGIPRHLITGGAKDPTHTHQTATNFDAVLGTAIGRELPEAGTLAERVAMSFHGNGRFRPSYKTDGTSADFEVNGLPPNAGAPYAEPCRSDTGAPVGEERYYAASVIELDVDFNKVGWHFAQQRILVLDGDIGDTESGVRAPEPLVMRANSGDCVDFDHTNRVPHTYQLDDFQVKTPTDVIGQHIHLVKFDVTSADGAANGWNYEDGTLAKLEIEERLHAFTATGGSWSGITDTDLTDNEAEYRTTRQRWYVDPGWSGNVFTHDHYGPSTHQQAGLYATMLIEPAGSVWKDPTTGTAYGGRFDGGPTSWRADIHTADPADSHREFYLEFADFQLAYRSAVGDGAGLLNGPNQAVNPSYRNEVGLPHILQPKVAPLTNPTVDDPPGCGTNTSGDWTGCAPEAISAADPGTFVVNYRNEPLALRLRDPATNDQAAGLAGDLSYAFSSGQLVDGLYQPLLRADARLNGDPSTWPYGNQTATEGALAGDPFTPMLRVYEGDNIYLRVQVGAHEEGHNFSMNGIRWLQNWQSGVSGFRSSQMAGISEYFIFTVPGLGAVKDDLNFEDYMYQAGSSTDARWNGTWGIMRAYDDIIADLQPLPSNPDGKTPPVGGKGGKPAFLGVCPTDAPERKFDLLAVRAADVLPGGAIGYHPDFIDPTGLLYVKKADLDKQGKLLAERRVEPLILRAAAGECIFITLTNQFADDPVDLDGFNTLPMIVNQFNNNRIAPSPEVGLHAQLVEYDMFDSDGMNVGFNPIQSVLPGETTTYKWYAGRIDIDETQPGNRRATPIEFGAINLMASDPIEGSSKGLIGALIIEPQGSTWNDGSVTGRGKDRDTKPDGDVGTDGLLTRAAIDIKDANGNFLFRDFVVIHQDDVNMRFANAQSGFAAGDPVPTVAAEEEPEDSGQKGINYRTDPIWHRLGVGPTANPADTRTVDYTNAFAGDPVTPIYTAAPGDKVRFRILKPGGHNRNSNPTLHGHVWARYPYGPGSLTIDPANDNTFWHGEQQGHGPTNHINVVPLNPAGPAGDYLYRDMVPVHVDNGEWAIMRVGP